MQKAIFGKVPSGERLARIEKSPHFKNGQFQNLSHTPQLVEGYTMLGITFERFFKTSARRSPAAIIPSIKSDLHHLPLNSNVLVWFGHSSYFIQLDGKQILIDPVLSGNASPIRGTMKAFKGTDVYSSEDIPTIDYLFITHDHYDHLDYETLLALKSKIKTVICGLGVGAHLEYWGFSSHQIFEGSWNDKISLDEGFTAYITPARHFSGRTLARNKTLWVSYVLQSPSMKIFIGGDSGYDTHFSDIGSTFGPIDFAILENGQYNAAWRYIHTLPHEVLKAAQDLKAKRLLPVHSCKFGLANHPWDEPLIKLTELNQSYNLPLATPMIGEVVHLDDIDQPFQPWWVGVK